MSEIRGRPLAACAALIMLWAGARIGLTDSGELIRSGKTRQISNAAETSVAARAFAHAQGPSQRRTRLHLQSPVHSRSPTKFADREKIDPILGINNRSAISFNRTQMTSPQPTTIAAKPAILITKSDSHPPPAQLKLYPSPFVSPSENRMTLYAYSFWRPGSSSNLEAAAPQYGGSQSGMIATYRLTKKGQGDVSLLMRAAITPGKFADKELALGFRTRPLASLPITLSAERRFRANSRDQYAVYAAGSLDNVALLHGVKARGFAQAGVIPGKNPNLFFDAGMRAERSIHNAGDADISIGAGAWSGGQRGASRFDVGPTIRTKIKLGAARLDVSADWRFRIMGDAQPKHGPAITISTGF